uniref:Secreted protein n=1 Tax=Knipowitschia caucasica TaxID=637954 RepID=A0AAV2KR70_KNICA
MSSRLWLVVSACILSVGSAGAQGREVAMVSRDYKPVRGRRRSREGGGGASLSSISPSSGSDTALTLRNPTQVRALTQREPGRRRGDFWMFK